MLEALVLLFQLCSITPCVVNVTKTATLITVCEKNAVDNSAWALNKVFASPDGKTVLVVRYSSAVCANI